MYIKVFSTCFVLKYTALKFFFKYNKYNNNLSIILFRIKIVHVLLKGPKNNFYQSPFERNFHLL